MKMKYKVFNRIDSYEEFVDYVLRKLGAPVIDINIDPMQLRDRISEAIQYYIEYDLESVAETWWIHKVTKEDEKNGYLTIPLDTLDILEVLSSRNNSSVSSVSSDLIYGDSGFGDDAFMTTFSWNWWNQYWYNGANIFSGNQSLFYYEISMQYLQMMKTLFCEKVEILYRRRQRKLWFLSRPIKEGLLYCIQGTKMLDPETETSIFSSDWLQRYATALVGIQWATNLSKFGAIPSAANLTINSDALLQRYMQEKLDLEDLHRLAYEEPPMPMFAN